MDVVRGQETQLVARLHFLHEDLVDGRQLGDAVLLQLDEEAFRPEDVQVFAHKPVGLVHIAGRDRSRDVGRHAAGGADEALAVGSQEVEIDARPVVIAVKLRAASDLQQVQIAGLVLGQQKEMGALAVELRVAVGHAPGGHVGLDADDRLDGVVLTSLVEGHDAIHDAVIGQGQGRLVELPGPLSQLVDAAQAVEQRIFGMNVEMDERLVFRYRRNCCSPQHGASIS